MTQRSYSELGKRLDALARSRDVRGPTAIAEYVQTKTGEGPNRSAWGQSLYGEITPSKDTVRLFAEAFELNAEQATSLAVLYVFGK